MDEALPIGLAGLGLAALVAALCLFADGLRARIQTRRYNRIAPPPRARRKQTSIEGD